MISRRMTLSRVVVLPRKRNAVDVELAIFFDIDVQVHESSSASSNVLDGDGREVDVAASSVELLQVVETLARSWLH